jgi:hypothetical protein
MSRNCSDGTAGLDSAAIVSLSIADYHSLISHVSKSMLDVLARSPSEFYGRYVSGTLPRQRGDSPVLAVGQALHTLVLEPDLFSGRFTVPPEFAPDGAKWDRRKTAHKDWWKEYEQQAGSKTLLTAEQHESVQGMAAALQAHGTASAYLEQPGEIEQSVLFQHCGVQCKARFDKVVKNCDWVIDLKSTSANLSSYREIAKTILQYGYHRQMALYSEAYQQLVGRACRFLLLFVSSEPPHDVAVVELSGGFQEAGRKEVEYLLNALKRRIITGDWTPAPCLSETVIDLPRGYQFEAAA